ncbi:MAG: glycosyltransferase family 39 protein [Candidatus Omnitrophica bacterium]|nr:glycosyltransferase family 39 protein [Candidatus Omnitrophota bacterium]MBU4487463.1 glycosyltransferase family 39 protein [Candidatus Omnitrophota bacterium]MCG2705109.1 glycosyltransferase family 39 protein [Candidatus Omnitrophota bacterium]
MLSALNRDNKILILVITVSLGIKLALLGYGIANVPSFISMPDTPTYLEPGVNLVETGTFATFEKYGWVKYEVRRTPGYPLFLGFLNQTLKIPFNGIVVVQILLTTFAGYIVYKAAYELDTKIALLSAFIFLFDLPVTISSLMLLSESLYAVFMAIFIYFFLKFLKGQKIHLLAVSAVILAAATYIRPISYYLGICIAIGVILAFFRGAPKRALWYGFIFLFIFYALVGAWNCRNYFKVGRADFTTIDNIDLRDMGLLHRYTRQSEAVRSETGPLLFYIKNTTKSFTNFMTRPGTLKYLRNIPLKVASKIFGYPWIIALIIGLFFARYNNLPKVFLLLTIIYFIVVSVVGVGLCNGSRFRVPIMPLISILAASGWIAIYSKIKKWGQR